MSTITIIGTGKMATAIGARAAKHGHIVEFVNRDTTKAQALADKIGNGSTVGAFGAKPLGDIVILALLYGNVVEVVKGYGDALAGKILVDITHPANSDFTGIVTTVGNSASDQITAIAPKNSHVVKAFNSMFHNVIAEDKPLDVFIASDSLEAKKEITSFAESLGMQPRDAGGLSMTHTLEWAGMLLMTLAKNGAGFGISLGAKLPSALANSAFATPQKS
jgi:predicted dinucleotide-binding enzyme